MGRQKLESRTSAETGNDSPYLEHITHQTSEKYHLKLEIMLKIFKLQQLIYNYKSRSTTYNNSFSRKTTGSGSLIAALSKPRASSDEYGAKTFNPGHEPYQDA
jgi:hypothetical protein